MICLQCGDCCIRFDIPGFNKSSGMRCPHLTPENKRDIYDKRPDMCKNHQYSGFAICPIGEQKQIKVPTGKCRNCGGIIFDGGDTCSQKCSDEYVAYLSNCTF